MHVDAYRLGGIAELDDLDLDASLDEAVTVVEWGQGLAETLAPDRLDIVVTRGDNDTDETRHLRITPAGPRWAESGVHLSVLKGLTMLLAFDTSSAAVTVALADP